MDSWTFLTWMTSSSNLEIKLSCRKTASFWFYEIVSPLMSLRKNNEKISLYHQEHETISIPNLRRKVVIQFDQDHSYHADGVDKGQESVEMHVSVAMRVCRLQKKLPHFVSTHPPLTWRHYAYCLSICPPPKCASLTEEWTQTQGWPVHIRITIDYWHLETEVAHNLVIWNICSPDWRPRWRGLWTQTRGSLLPVHTYAMP